MKKDKDINSDLTGNSKLNLTVEVVSGLNEHYVFTEFAGACKVAKEMVERLDVSAVTLEDSRKPRVVNIPFYSERRLERSKMHKAQAMKEEPENYDGEEKNLDYNPAIGDSVETEWCPIEEEYLPIEESEVTVVTTTLTVAEILEKYGPDISGEQMIKLLKDGKG